VRTYYGWEISNHGVMWWACHWYSPAVNAPTLRELKAKIKKHVDRWGW
jgi:hypothetical protein